MALIDEYTLKAQIAPVVLIATLPGIALTFLFPELDWKTAVVPPTALVALSLAAAAFSRERGKRRETGLHAEWGGKPTTVMLRYRSKTFPERQLANLHRFLAKATCNTIPTAKREDADQAAADVVYESLTRHLREGTRDKKAYPFVFRELTHYGFMRNLWGLRGTAILFAVVTLAVTTVWLLLSSPWVWDIRCVAPALNIVAIFLWGWWPDKLAVRHAAEAYANAILAAGLKMAEAEPVEV